MNVFQNELCIRVHLKARCEWSETCLTIRNMPIIRGQILGRAWPVRSWWTPAASALPELSRCTRWYQVSIPRTDLLVEREGLSDVHLICAVITGPMRAKDLQCVAVTFFWKNLFFVCLFVFERKSFFPNSWVLGSYFLNLLKRLWGSGKKDFGTWSIERKDTCFKHISLFWLDYIFVKRKKIWTENKH